MSDAHTVSSETGMSRMTAGLWIATAAAVLQLTAIGTDFYQIGQDSVRGAWLGIPHTTQLVLLSAVVSLVLVALTAGDRSPLRGRMVGAVIAGVGLIATAQLVYRMIVPPFGGCLTFNCAFTPNNPNVTLLTGIWIALVGNVGATLGGLVHAASSKAERTASRFWRADSQTGMTPWLGLAALSGAGMFLVGFTILDFYAVPTEEGGFTLWSAWIAIPHTSGLVLVAVLAIVGLAYAAARNRAPMNPQALGATVAVLGFLAASRTLYRIVVTPFYSGPAANAGFPTGTQIGASAWAALALGIVAIVAGIVHAVQNSPERAPAGQPAASHGG